MDKVQGIYVATIFHSDANGFSVCRFKCHELNEKSMIITGYFPQMETDVLYELEGEYVEHPRFGIQFSVVNFKKMLPQDETMIIRFLSGPLFPGIGQKLAEQIVEEYGPDILVNIKENPAMPLHVKGLTPKKKEVLIKGITHESDLDEAVSFFTLHGLSIRNIMKIDTIYGSKSLDLIRENPYRMVYDIDGIGFKTADKLAYSMGFSKDDTRRLEALCLSRTMDLCMKNGDTYLTASELFSGIQLLYPEFTEELFQTILVSLFNSGRLVKDDDRIYHNTQFEAETMIADYFSAFPLQRIPVKMKQQFSELLAEVQRSLAIEYDSIQQSAIHTFFTEDVSLITGGPGTGKTTIVLGIVELLKLIYPEHSILLCAPTGRAAKRLKEVTNIDALTIHSALKWNLETNTFGCNQDDPLPYDILILDEFSMVDNWLMANLLKASSQIRKILFIGDKDQIPSVSPGFVIRDFLRSDFFKVTELETIYRQQEGSEVIQLAKLFNQGVFDISHTQNDVKFYPVHAANVKEYVLKIVESALDKGYSLNDIQVLVPQYANQGGIDQLNHFLQTKCNPASVEKRELKIGYKIFRESDKILQLKNQPDDFVFNGDIGIIEEIIFAAEDENNQNRIIARFDHQIVEYTRDTFINISHAYCMSIHKAQGSEYPIVILMALKSYGIMLQRRLYYTAITRASKALVLIGEQEAFQRAALNNHVHDRRTWLTERLQIITAPEKFI